MIGRTVLSAYVRTALVVVASYDYFSEYDFYVNGGAWRMFWYSCYDRPWYNGKGFFGKAGNAMGYFCNYNSGGSPCVLSEWEDFVNDAGGRCRGGTNGWKQAAWISLGSWGKSYGYDHINSEHKICG